MTLHRSHYRWPEQTTEDGRQSTDQPIHAPSCVTQVQPRPIAPPRGGTKRPLLHMSETDCGQATHHRCTTPPPRTWWTEAEKRETSSGSTGPRRLAARSPMIGHIHSSRCRRTGLPSKPKRRPNLVRRRIPMGGRSGKPEGSVIGDRHRSGALARLGRAGGARRDRTDDLMLAKHALSQLSYGPGRRTDDRARRTGGTSSCPPWSVVRPWWAWEDSNFRPHAYQARALTN